MRHLLGLTGSIGMGKSTTAQMFRDEDVPVWDADACVHALYDRDGAAVDPIGAKFPDAIVDGAVSRNVLKHLIAEDSAVLAAIEAIVHPLVAADRQEFLKNNKAPLLVFDIPLLFETKADAWLTSVLVVSVPGDVQKQRVMARPGMTEAQFEAMMAKQMPDAEKRARADHIIETLDMDDTRAAVRHLIGELTGAADA
ncbi:dephospho-CoA kinase [Cognatiyoonia sp. IB215446]|uniref:dephospho-CoA kinase n=1 Tax=Cognatiyoonia sp. IB215446 TaxID=3097355 RepID=UPI002A0DEB9B|nr:dephospho-CoA kinase [Cognatiyoonia sp. IB215446]MDX8349191.1 dephospho-CoA kinase [Cognatiyoonia sp. IB215446]